MASPKKLLTEKQADRIRKTAETDPQKALKDLRSTMAVRAGIHSGRKFSIDAIKRTTKRRAPLSGTGSLDQEFMSEHSRKELIATARDLFLNFSFGKGILRQHVKNMIGVGPRLQATTIDDKYNKRAEEYWNRTKNNIDVRKMSFAASLRVGEQSEVIDGDYGQAIVEGGHTQFIEADRIGDPPADKRVRGRQYVGGVELKKDGCPVAYHIWNRSKTIRGKMTYNRRIEYENFIHCFRPERFDQTRGMSWLVSAVNDMQDLRETLDAAKGKWKLENMLGVAIESDAPENDTLTSLWGELTGYTESDSDGNAENKNQVKLGQGIHSFELRPGEKIKTIESTTPNNTFEPMTLLLIRMIALVLDMPLEIALQYFTKGSFSAHRSAFLQYDESVKTRRQEIEEGKIDRLYGWKIQRAIKAGELAGPEGDTNPTTHLWQWPSLGLLDPDKQRKGDKEGYKLAVESISDITGRDGKFWQDVAEQRIKEIVWITDACKAAKVDPAMVLPAVSDPGEKPNSTTEPPDGGDNNEED